MLSKLFEALYNKVFINIVVEDSQSIVYVEQCDKSGVINSDSENFDTKKINPKMYEFINSYIGESPFYYISILDNSTVQGAIPTCKSRDMSEFADIDSLKYVCHKNKWAYYTSKSDLNSLQKSYSNIGLDFIFSPFSILANFFKDKINKSLALYILIEHNSIALSVFDNSKLLFADYIDMKSTEYEELLMDDHLMDDEDVFDLDGSIDLDNLEAMDDIENLDDFGNIEDLDTIEEIDEFAESEVQENLSEEDAHNAELDDVETFNEDYNRFTFIQDSIKNYYNDSKYESKFVENIYIADSVGVSGDLKKYLEEEMFLSVFVRQLDLSAEVCEMAKAELK